MNGAAMAPQGRTNRAYTRATGALLPPQLATGAADFALVFRLVGAGANFALIPARRFVQQVRIHLRAKNRVGELHFAHFLATQIDYVHNRHDFLSFFNSSNATNFTLNTLLPRLLLFAHLADKNVR